MAFLRNKVLGMPTGKVGDLIFKSLHGSTLIASPASSFRTPMDEASVTRRSKFRFVVKLSSAIIKLLSIKVLLKKNVINGKSAFNNIVSSAYDRVSGNNDISKVKLLEKIGFVVPNPAVTMNPTSIKIDTDALGDSAGIDAAVEKTVSLEGVVYLSSPLESTDPAYCFIPFSSDDITLDTATALSFTVPFLAGDGVTYQGYSVKKVLAALVTKDANGEPVKASMTFFN